MDKFSAVLRSRRRDGAGCLPRAGGGNLADVPDARADGSAAGTDQGVSATHVGVPRAFRSCLATLTPPCRTGEGGKPALRFVVPSRSAALPTRGNDRRTCGAALPTHGADGRTRGGVVPTHGVVVPIPRRGRRIRRVAVPRRGVERPIEILKKFWRCGNQSGR